ncbi:hypothetical protein BJY01DRAFT_221311 [Aspergillus pseudoustus]|uniref:Alpha/Beta hydrolase protein n=1 Tax=Aspergillus pseudoustus TaxID=1810923 RepID=A0ABR4JBL0_9EURO
MRSVSPTELELGYSRPLQHPHHAIIMGRSRATGTQLLAAPPRNGRNLPTGVLHHYADRLVAFEYSTNSSGAPRVKPHTLLFIGGLGDGLGTVEYVADIVAALEDTEWSLFCPILSSSYGGWGMSGLTQDVQEIALCVEYILGYKRRSSSSCSSSNAKIVVMGHSTGCQDVMQYISAPNPDHHRYYDSGSAWDRGLGSSTSGVGISITRPQIDGAIMQAPVSDREAIQWVLREGNKRHSPEELQRFYSAAIKQAQKHTFEDYHSLDTVVPLPATACLGFPASTPISSRRFLSLASPGSPQDPGEDDLFSSDLTDDRLRQTFGAIHGRGVLRSKLLVLYSGRDETVPPSVDKVHLLRRWQRATDADQAHWHEQSGVIPGASHTISGAGQAKPRQILVRKVMRFLCDMTKDSNIPKVRHHQNELC